MIEGFWVITVKIGKCWHVVRNTKVCGSKKSALEYMQREEMSADCYKPLRVLVWRERAE